MSVGLLTVVTRCLTAHRAQDWEALRMLFHHEARIGVFSAGGAPVAPDTAITAMREAHRKLTYHADVRSAHVLDDCAVLLEGHVRMTSAQGRYEIANRVWLYVILDGLLYRSQVFTTASEAREAYARLGRDLGVASDSRA